MARPLLSRWRIHAQDLPEDMLEQTAPDGFILPGAKALLDFADLIGAEEPDAPLAAPDQAEDSSIEGDEAPFPLPAMIPADVCGGVTLSCEVDFGAISGDQAFIAFDQLIGSGCIRLGDTSVASFGGAFPGALTIDASDALRRGRKETLFICFDETRPAGVPGPIFLRAARHARINSLILTPSAVQRLITVSAEIRACTAGDYVLRLQEAPAVPSDTPVPAREITFSLSPGNCREVGFSMPVSGESFVPGKPYAPPALRAELLLRSPGKSRPRDTLCDSMTLLCGYPGRTPTFFLPLTPEECAQDVSALAVRLHDLHIPCVSLDFPAGEFFYREMTHAGIAVRQWLPQDHPLLPRLRRYPCVTIEPLPAIQDRLSPSAALSAWQLCGVCGMERMPDPDLTPADLLFDAAGRAIDPSDERLAAVLDWLRAVLIRLRAEAVRQGRCSGALCAPGEWDSPDIADAIRAALRPDHLSVLPLLGAWWTGTRFSASVEAIIPEPMHSLHARLSLEDEEGNELARFTSPVRETGGYVGVMECMLPDTPCALTLCVRLTQGINEILIEEYTLPVYVGERGALEAAFR